MAGAGYWRAGACAELQHVLTDRSSGRTPRNVFATLFRYARGYRLCDPGPTLFLGSGTVAGTGHGPVAWVGVRVSSLKGIDFFLVWSDAFGRTERALPTEFRFCVRGDADTRVPVSQNRRMSTNESQTAADPALRGAHLEETKFRGQIERMGTTWGYPALDRHNGAGCVPAHRSASGHLAQGL